MAKGRKRKQLSLSHVPAPAPSRRGNPIFAMRVNSDMLARYVRHCGGMREAQDRVRTHMRVTLGRAERSS